MTPPAITQQITFLTCEDLQGTSDFYAETLGLPLVLDQGDCRIHRVAGEAFLGICRRRDGRPLPPRGVVVTFVTDAVDEWYAHLVARGVAVEGPPAENPAFAIYNFFARDPNGYLIEFQRFLTADWPAPGSAAADSTGQRKD